MKVRLIQENGTVLVIPKNGHAASLLLEMIAETTSGAMLHKVIDDRENNEFKIKLNISEQAYQTVANYINDNS